MIKLRVLFISRIYPNSYSTNGRVFHSQAKELIRQGLEVKVISPIPFTPKFFKKRKSLWEEYSLLPSQETFDGINVYFPRYLKIPNVILNNSLRKISESSLSKSVMNVLDNQLKDYEFDLVHCHMTYPDGIVGEYIKKKYNVPFIVSARSSDLDISVHNNYAKSKMRDVFATSNGIVTPSPQLEKKLKEKFGYDSTIIGNGIYPEKLKRKASNETEKNDKITILSISNLMKTKGIQYNIKAMKKLSKEFPDLQYLIIGDGDYKNQLIELTKELELTSKVFFLGEKNNDEAMQYMKECDIFSLPSWRETFGLVYIEAMYFNKPIILCEQQGIDGIVKNDISCKLVAPHSYEDVYSAIKELLIDSNKRELICKNGNKIVENYYTWGKIGDRLKELYLTF